MATQFSNEQPHVFFKAPLAVKDLSALLQGMESDLNEHPIDAGLETGVRILRLFDGNMGGTPGYVVTFGAASNDMTALRVDVVTGRNDPAKITAAKALIGRGGEFIGFADFAAAAGTETAVIYRRAVATAPNGTDGGGIGGVIQDPGHDVLNRIQALNPHVEGGLDLAGLARNGLQTVRNAGGVHALIMVTDCDIDTDGPGGSREKDPCWLPRTSLRDAAGTSCNSRTFPGVVLPPEITARFGVRMGDFGFVFHNDKIVACQVYDGGPSEKIGEVSVGLAWAAEVNPFPAAGASTGECDEIESRAARRGNDVRNLVTIIFPGSGNQHASSPADIQTRAQELLQSLTT